MHTLEFQGSTSKLQAREVWGSGSVQTHPLPSLKEHHLEVPARRTPPANPSEAPIQSAAHARPGLRFSSRTPRDNLSAAPETSHPWRGTLQKVVRCLRPRSTARFLVAPAHPDLT